MAAPLATEKVLRGTLQALQRGGLLSSGADVSKLEQIPNNATDQDISDILDTIVFGGVAASTDVVRGDDDVNIFVDADNNDAPLVHQRYFRVAQDQSDPPVTSPTHELATVSYRASGATWRTAELTVGPRTTIATSAHNGSIRIGADTTHHYGNLLGGDTAVAASFAGLKVGSTDKIGLQSDVAVVVTDEAGGDIRGGWESLTSTTKFHVGDFLASPQESFLIEQNILAGPLYNYTLRPSNDTSAGIKRIYIRGSNPGNNYWSHTMVGGKSGETWGDPNNFGNATFSVVGDAASTTANAAYIYDRKNNRASSSEIFTIQANTVPGSGFFYFRILDNAGGGVFNVDSDGNVNIDSLKSYTTAGGDVAELVVADAEYKPGTVLCLRDGGFTHTSTTAQTNVVGVVATQPGVVLGTSNNHDRSKEFMLEVLNTPGQTDVLNVRGRVSNDYGQYICPAPNRFVKILSATQQDDSVTLLLQERVVVYEGAHIYAGITQQQNLNRMAICGFVPVMCSTEQGDITGNGEFLVSGPDGCAVVDPDPRPGTIIGKAKGILKQNGSGVVKGLVEVLVNLQ